MFHCMLVAPQVLKSLLPVEDFFSDKAMRYTRTSAWIRAHQSIEVKHKFAQEKKKAASVNHLAIVVLMMNKTCGTFP